RRRGCAGLSRTTSSKPKGRTKNVENISQWRALVGPDVPDRYRFRHDADYVRHPATSSSPPYYMSQPRRPRSDSLPAAAGSPVPQGAATNDLHRLHFHADDAGSKSNAPGDGDIQSPDFRRDDSGAYTVSEAGRQAVAYDDQQLAVEPGPEDRTAGRLPAFSIHIQFSRSRTHGLAVGHLRQHFSGNGSRPGKPGRNQRPPGSSVGHLLVPYTQARIGDVSNQRRHGRLPDHPGRTGNPRHRA